MAKVYLTTIDNPYSPVTQYTEWKAYDELMGYYTNEYLARIARVSPDLSPDDYALAVEEAIDEIVELNITGMYKKVYAEEEPVSFDVNQTDSNETESDKVDEENKE